MKIWHLIFIALFTCGIGLWVFGFVWGLVLPDDMMPLAFFFCGILALYAGASIHIEVEAIKRKRKI